MGGEFAALHAGLDAWRVRFGARYLRATAASAPISALALARARAWCRRRDAARGRVATRALFAALSGGGAVPGRVARAGGAGWGLFARRALRQGEALGEYSGVLVEGWRGGRFRPYLLRFPFPFRWAVDAGPAGNELRFVNHSSRAANLDRDFVFHDGLPRPLLIASRAIAAGEQLLLDYGPGYAFARPPLELTP